MNTNEKDFKAELIRQFGNRKKDIAMFILAPAKYAHHFDSKTLAAYNKYKQVNE